MHIWGKKAAMAAQIISTIHQISIIIITILVIIRIIIIAHPKL